MRETNSGVAGGALRRALAVAGIVAAVVTPSFAKEVVKVATLAPQGSVWDTTLRGMGASWTKSSAGAVEWRLYPGGVAGDESDVVRKMRLGQFQGAALTATGLAEIDAAFSLFFLPMFFDSWAEVDHALAALRPELERRLEAKGYKLLLWGHGGWVHLFSREPIREVADLKRQKLFVWAGDDASVQSWRARGFQPVPLAATDVTMGIQTRMIDVVPASPIAALSLQWFRQTPYMQGLGLAPLVGGVVLRLDAWQRIPAAARDGFAASIAEAERTLAAEVPRQDAGAIEEMKARGLQVVEIGEAQRGEWRRQAEEFARSDREGSVPPEILASARAAVVAFRSREPMP